MFVCLRLESGVKSNSTEGFQPSINIIGEPWVNRRVFLSFRYTLRVTLSITLHMKIGLISAGVWFHLECTETFSSFFLSKEFLI